MSLQPFDIRLLPSQDSVSYIDAAYCRPRKRIVTFEEGRFFLPFPYVVFATAKNVCPCPDCRDRPAYYVFFSNEINETCKLYDPPLPNISEGNICMGENFNGQTPADLATAFWQTAFDNFTHILSPFGTASDAIECMDILETWGSIPLDQITQVEWQEKPLS